MHLGRTNERNGNGQSLRVCELTKRMWNMSVYTIALPMWECFKKSKNITGKWRSLFL